MSLPAAYTGPADKSPLRSRLLSQVCAPFVFAQLRRLRNCGSSGSKENVTGKKEERAAFFDPPIHLSKSPSEHQDGGLSPLSCSALAGFGRASYSPNPSRFLRTSYSQKPSRFGRALCSPTPSRFFLCQTLLVGPGWGIFGYQSTFGHSPGQKLKQRQNCHRLASF